MDRAAARRERRTRALDRANPERTRRGSVRPVRGDRRRRGRVDLVGHNSDTSFFGSRPLDTPAVPDAFDTIATLAHRSFDGRAVIISKAGPRVSARTLEWLRHRRFHELTGVAPDDVYFVRARSDKPRSAGGSV